MHFIIRYWKKLLYFLITGSTSVFIAACYGTAVGFVDSGRWTIKARNKENEPIPGLDVMILHYAGDSKAPDTFSVQQTDSAGLATFFLTTYDKKACHRHEAAIRDTDDAENKGLFLDTLIVKTEAEESIVTMQPRP